MTERRVTVRFDYQGNLINNVRTLHTELEKGTKRIAVYKNGVLQSSTVTQTLGNRVGGLSSALNGAMLRFIGLNAVLSLGQKAFRDTIEWVNKSIDEFREFENSMAEVSTILTGDTYQSLYGLTAAVERLSVQFGQSAVDMSRALYQILSAAVDVKESIGLLTTATKASIAGLTSVETSVDVLTSILNSYGKEVTQAANVSDILFQTVVRGKLRFEDLAAALGYITPIAASAGVEFEELAAALATVTRMGLHVDMASRGLALAIQNVVSPTQQAKAAAEEYGVEMSAVGMRVFGLRGFIEDLNRAVDEFGLTVLPSMVKNMRSLRVVLALASDEGLKGFKEDLDLVYSSTGRTDEALSKMIRTQQREAEVVAQSQQLLERRIGEVWSPIKRNIEATKLWFAAFFTSGFSIEKANRELGVMADALRRNRELLYDSIEAMSVGGQTSLFEQLFDIDDDVLKDIGKVTEAAVDFEKISKYLSAQKMIQPGATGFTQFEWVEKLIDYQIRAARKTIQYTSEGAMWEDLLTRRQHPLSTEMLDQFQSAADRYVKMFEGMEGVDVGSTVESVVDAFQQLSEAVDVSMNVTLDNITNFRGEFDKFFGAIDAARENVFNLKTDIIELEYAMDGLRTEIRDIYTTLAGTQHEGTLGLEIDTKSFDIALDRLSSFSQMIREYGDEYESMFYELMEGKTFTVDDEEISYIDEYNMHLKDSIQIVQRYNEAAEKRKKLESEIGREMRRNSLAIMKLELAGMMRRRGLTRTEERTIKQIEIRNAELRIQEKEAEIEAEADIDQEAYDEAVDRLKEYFDRQRFLLDLMKDARDDDLDHLRDVYAQKERTLERYGEAMEIQNRKLARAYDIEISLLEYLETKYPDIADLYEEVYGVSIPEAIETAEDAQDDWLNQLYAEDDELRKLIELYNNYHKSKQSGSGAIPEQQQYKIAQSYSSGSTVYAKSTSGAIRNFRMENPAEAFKAVLPGGKYAKGNAINWKRGTYYVPADNLYNLHRGEQVVPAGRNAGDTYNVAVNVSGNYMASEIDENRLAAKIGAAVEKKLIDRKSGKTHYRMM